MAYSAQRVFDSQDQIRFCARNIIGAGVDERLGFHAVASDTLTFPLTNHQGSTLMLVAEDGQLVTSEGDNGAFVYDEYGGSVGAVSPAGYMYRYTGRRLDAQTGLYYYRARYYDPETARFLQTDPIGYEDQMNLYAYVHNDPFNGSDPSGMNCNGPQGRCVGQVRRPRTQAEKDYQKGVKEGFHQVFHDTFIFNTGGPNPTGLGFWMEDGYAPRYDPPENVDVARGRVDAGWISGGMSFILGARGTGTKTLSEATLTEVHHTIAKKSVKSAPARLHAQSFGLDVANGTFNLVRLPKKFHRRLHRNSYFHSVNTRILNQTSAAGIKCECSIIANELRSIRNYSDIDKMFPKAK